MADKRDLIIAVISGSCLTLIGAFLLHPTISILKTSSPSYVDINQVMPHYEFFTNDPSYVEYLEINYKIFPPFFSFFFNSDATIKFPEGYFLIEKIHEYSDECITWKQENNNELNIHTEKSQFTFPECSATLKFAKTYKKDDIIRTIFNASWRKDFENNRSFEEEGIELINKLSKPIRNYMFIYNQSNTSQLKKRFSECKEMKIFLNQFEYPFRHNYFQNSSIIAIKIDLEPRDHKDVIIRCYN